MLTESPFILYSDGEGNIFEDTSLYVTGRSGWDALPIPVDEWIELPTGGNLYELPGRKGIGIDVETGFIHGSLRNRKRCANASVVLLHCRRMAY